MDDNVVGDGFLVASVVNGEVRAWRNYFRVFFVRFQFWRSVTNVSAIAAFFSRLSGVRTRFELRGLKCLIEVLRVRYRVHVFECRLDPTRGTRFTAATTQAFVFQVRAYRDKRDCFAKDGAFHVIARDLLRALGFFLQGLEFRDGSLRFCLDEGGEGAILEGVLRVAASFNQDGLSVPRGLLLRFLRHFSVACVLTRRFTCLYEDLVVVFFCFFLEAGLVGRPVYASFRVASGFLFKGLGAVGDDLVGGRFLSNGLLQGGAVQVAIGLTTFVLNVRAFVLRIQF